MIARPAIGPTTAPAIQALLFSFFSSGCGSAVGPSVDSAPVALAAVDCGVDDREEDEGVTGELYKHYCHFLESDVVGVHTWSANFWFDSVITPIQRADSTEDVCSRIRVLGVFVHEAGIAYGE